MPIGRQRFFVGVDSMMGLGSFLVLTGLGIKVDSISGIFTIPLFNNMAN
jgi:hypothetical protein